MRRFLLLAFSISLFASLTFAKGPTTKLRGDPNDSGYTSPYLEQLRQEAVAARAGKIRGAAAATTSVRRERDNDDPRARMEALREARSGNPRFTSQLLREAAKERARYPRLMVNTNQTRESVTSSSSSTSTPRWKNIGPIRNDYISNGVVLHVTDSGRLRSILPDPNDPDTVYLLTSSGGLWKTTNFNDERPDWDPKTDQTVTTSGGAASFGRNSRTIYVGLGDPFQNGHSTAAFMIKTTDAANHFSAAIPLPFATQVRDVKVDTSGPQDRVFVATDFGLYVSMDSGATYNFAPDAVFIFDAGGGNLFANTVWSIVKTSAGWVLTTQDITGAGAMAISTDHGATWHPINNAGNVFTGAGRTTLGVGKSGDKSVYAFAANTGDAVQLDLFRSSNGGQDWAALGLPSKTPTNPNPDQPNMDLMQIQAFYNQMLLVDPTDKDRNTVYIGGELSSAKSTDGGNTWTIIANWLAQFGLPYVHADYHAAAFLAPPKRHDDDGRDEHDEHERVRPTLFFGSDGGLFISRDGGLTWNDKKNAGIISDLGYSINSTPDHPDSSIMGLQDNGTFVRKGDSKVWEQPLGADGLGTGWSQANHDVALGTFEFSLLFRSTIDNPIIQDDWDLAINGIDRTFNTFFTSIATPTASADPTGHTFLTYTLIDVYKTTDGAANWGSIGHSNAAGGTATPGLENRIFRDAVHGIGVSPTPGTGINTVAVVCRSGWVVTTHDGGANWTQTNLIATVPGWQGFNASAEWADNSTLYIASESPFSGGRVAKSTDGGITFVDVTNGLPDLPVNRILVSRTDPNTVYAATFLGVYRSTNGGASWSRFGAGLPQVEVHDIYMPPNGSFLRIATYGRGVWELRLN